MPSGVLYGVSVGPGDPELLTLKAVRTIGRCPVLAAPRTHGKDTLALDIVKGALDVSKKEIIYLDFDMLGDKKAREAAHLKLAKKVFAKLDEGCDVALLNLGDATLYGTWPYVEKLALDAGYSCETVCGVTSFCASAAKLHTGLTEMQLPLHIIPCLSSDLASELSQPGTKVLMKAGKALSKVMETLEELGMLDKASMVVNCCLPGERVLEKMEVAGDEGYFATVLVRA